MFLSEQLKTQIKDHCFKTPDEEVCGLLVKKNDELLVFPCRNVAKDKKHYFEIDTEDYLRADYLGEIMGIFHSHVTDKPSFSELDKVQAREHNLISVLYNVPRRTFSILDSNTTIVSKYDQYINPNFEIGKNDCLTVIQNFYSQELNITISDYFRNDNWKKTQLGIIEENYEKEGFVRVQNHDYLRLYDVLLFGPDDCKFVTHMGIYLGENEILHSTKKHGTKIDDLNKWKNKLRLVLRHRLISDE